MNRKATRPAAFVALACLLASVYCVLACAKPSAQQGKGLYAGAAATNIDPPKLPVIQNGGFTQRIAKGIVQPLYARSLVLKNADATIAICVVDTCMIDRKLCDRAKALVTEKTGIPTDRILLSATHTHSAPSAMRCLGCPPDPDYPDFLVPKIVESIGQAAANLQPAEAGCSVADAGEFTNTRRWIYLSHKMKTDPYGKRTIRAMMHPGHANPATAGPSGPEDPDLTLLSIRTRDGEPLAVLGNLSQHYYARGALSSGFTGTFCKLLETKFGGAFVGLMSQGTSGDLQWMDYSKPRGQGFIGAEKNHYDAYCKALADRAEEALGKIEYRADCVLAMDEQKLQLGRRLPDKERVAWAKPIVEKLGDRLPRNQPEVMAKEVFWIQENPTAEVKLQALRVGDLCIATLPNEVYGLTGLKLKLQSPTQPLMVVELANGASGYIPPPEQHQLGGYTTWPALTAGLEIEAEPKMVATLLSSLESVTGKKRLVAEEKIGAHGKRLLAQKPAAWWRMSEHSGNRIADSSGNNCDARLEPGYALFLPGSTEAADQDFCAAAIDTDGASEFASTPRGNRAVHFAGGRMVSAKPALDRSMDYSVSLWFWNAMPHDARAVTGYFFSLGEDGNKMIGDHLGISGTAIAPAGRLLFYNGDGDQATLVGKTELKRQRWHHVLLVRQGETVRAWLDGRAEAEFEAQVPDTRPAKASQLYIGGRADSMFGFEGKIDEIAVFDRALKGDEPILKPK